MALKVVVHSDHALLQHKLTILRDRATDFPAFHRVIRELGVLMAAEATRTLPWFPTIVQTPVPAAGAEGHANAEGLTLKNPSAVIIPILRAGLTMAEGLQDMLPMSQTGHIGIYRKSRDELVTYLVSIPVDPAILAVTTFFLVDPMIATGATMSRALGLLRIQGVSSAQIRVVSLVAARAGLRRLEDDPANTGVNLHLAAIDDDLTEEGYVSPGLGDAGDRQFGTLKPRNPAQYIRKDIA